MFRIREADAKDIPAIVAMIANDPLGQLREEVLDPLPQTYIEAFERIMADHNQELVVLENARGEIRATLQLSFIQYLTYKGGIRAQIEAVRVHEDSRGTGIGRFLLEWAINRSRERGAHMVQLTTDKKRPAALKFYERLGFKPTHEGIKLHLP